MKRCTKCNEMKPFSEFNKGSSFKDGLQYNCRKCQNEARNAHRAAHKKENKDYNDKYRAEHPEVMREWNAAHKEHKSRYNKIRYAQLKEEEAARKARKKSIVQMSEQEIKESILYRKEIRDMPCFYCGNHRDTMEEDHCTPLSRGGSDHWWNLVRSCGRCNNSKHTQTAREFMAGRLTIPVVRVVEVPL